MTPLRILAVLALSACVSSNQTSDCSYHSLLKHLNKVMSDNDLQAMRPVKNWTTATIVKMDLYLYGILEVDEKGQTLTNHIWTMTHWINEFLTWDPANFCGIDMLTIPRSNLWTPDVYIQEDASDTSSIQTSPYLTVHPDGLVVMVMKQKLTYTCRLQLQMFPFDTQTCQITFTSMCCNENYLRLGRISNSTDITTVSRETMITHGEWTLQSLNISEAFEFSRSTNQSRLIYMVTMERKPLLYLINLIVPLFYFLILDLSSFFINESRGEKMSFKITILLSISVLLLILQDMLPSTEDSLPMIAIYCVAVFALVGLSVLEAMLMVFLIDFNEQHGKKIWKSAKVQEDIELEVSSNKEAAGGTEKCAVEPQKNQIPLVFPSERHLLKLILDEVKAVRQVSGGQEKDKTESGCYLRLAYILDTVYFFLYLLTVVIFLITMYIMWVAKLF